MTGTAVLESAELARPPRRLASLVYESLLVAALVFLATLLFPGAATGNLSGPARYGLFVYLVVVTGGYFVGFWSRGQTLAMRAWRLRLVGADGLPPRWPRALVRYLAALVLVAPGLGGALWLREHPGSVIAWTLLAVLAVTLASPLWDAERRALYDRIAGTLLVRVR